MMLIRGLKSNAHNIGGHMEEDYLDDFDPMRHDLDEYYNELAEEFADEFKNNNDKSEV